MFAHLEHLECSHQPHTGSVPFFCGADVWTVCVTTFTVRVVVEGDSSPPPVAAQKAGGKATGGKAKQPKASGGKAIAKQPKRTAASKPRRGGGGAAILSVPGLSKKEVAALNKAARASAKRMAADSDDGW